MKKLILFLFLLRTAYAQITIPVAATFVAKRDSGVVYVTPTGLAAGGGSSAGSVKYTDSTLKYITPTQLGFVGGRVDTSRLPYTLIGREFSNGTLHDSLLIKFTILDSILDLRYAPIGGSGTAPFADNVALVYNNSDNTKKVILSAASVTTATTRTLTSPDATGTLVLNDNTATLTNKTIAGGSNTITGIAESGITNLTTDLSAKAPLASALFTQTFGRSFGSHSSNYTLGLDWGVEGTANSFTFTLPTAVGHTGREYYIVNIGTGTITIATNSSQTIGGQSSGANFSLTQNQSIYVVSNNTNWDLVAKN